jgi:hypothetical protein
MAKTLQQLVHNETSVTTTEATFKHPTHTLSCFDAEPREINQKILGGLCGSFRGTSKPNLQSQTADLTLLHPISNWLGAALS